MPYKSMAQRSYMLKNKPEMAKKWDSEYGKSDKYPKSLKSTMKDMVKRRKK